MSNLLSIQDNLLKESAKELLRTDLLHLTTKEQNKHTEYAIDSYVLVHYRTGLPPTRLHTSWKGPMKLIKGLNSRYTLLDLITGKEMDFHVSDMKPFVFDNLKNLSPLCRSNSDLMFCGQCNRASIDILIHEFCCNLSNNEFIDLYKKAIINYGFLVINNNSIKDNDNINNMYGRICTPKEFL